MIGNVQNPKNTKDKREKSLDSDDESDSDTDSDDDETNDKYFVEDKRFSPKFKDISGHIKSFRIDAVIGLGLKIGRNTIEEHFLESKLRLNDKKVLKKSARVYPGDVMDLIVDEIDDVVKVKRVRLLTIGKEKTKSDKFSVKLRVWNSATEVEQN